MPADVWRDRRACVGRTRSAATAWLCDEEECYMTYLPLRGLYHNLSIGVVWSFSWPGGDSYILALGFPCKPSIRTTSHFPCSIGLYFSSVSKESDLRVNGCFHGCVDSPLVARWIFVSFSSYFRQFFVCGLFLRFWGVLVRICWWESWIVAPCIFVLDLDPPNSEFGLQLKDFGWNLRSWLSSVAIRFLTI
jgi:hypothetical protein